MRQEGGAIASSNHQNGGAEEAPSPIHVHPSWPNEATPTLFLVSPLGAQVSSTVICTRGFFYRRGGGSSIRENRTGLLLLGGTARSRLTIFIEGGGVTCPRVKGKQPTARQGGGAIALPDQESPRRTRPPKAQGAIYAAQYNTVTMRLLLLRNYARGASEG